MTKPYDVGRRFEQYLVHRFKRLGWFSIRTPASGRGWRTGYTPDIICIKNRNILLIECKVLSGPRALYIEKPKVQSLIKLAKLTGGHAYICVYYRKDKLYRFIDPRDPEYNTNKYYGWSKTYVLAQGKTLYQIINQYS